MKLIILDRDGVINQDSEHYIKSPEEWVPLAGSLEAIARLNQGGYRVMVATNQSGIARGLFDIDALQAIHQKMQNVLEKVGGHIDGIFFCPHGPDARCRCRKPKPGLFHQIEKRLRVDLHEVPAVGDSLRDIIAAQRAGATPILVRTGSGQRTQSLKELPRNIRVFQDLAAAVDALIN